MAQKFELLRDKTFIQYGRYTKLWQRLLPLKPIGFFAGKFPILSSGLDLMDPLTSKIPHNSLQSPALNDAGSKMSEASSSMWHGLKMRALNLITKADSATAKANWSQNRPLTLPTLAKAVSERTHIFFGHCAEIANQVGESMVCLWRSFLLQRENSIARQKVRKWIYLSPKGCLLSAAVAAALTSFAIASVNESFKKRWLGFTGLACSAALIVYMA